MENRSAQKAALRKDVMAVLQKTPREVFRQAGASLKDFIEGWLGQQAPKSRLRFGCFKSLKDEVDTAPINDLLQSLGHARYFPTVTSLLELEFFDEGQKRAGLSELDVIFVPGLAFGRDGTRLGRGKGCYDRFLSPENELAPGPLLVALALDCQVRDDVPTEAHDVCMDYLCTPKLGMHKVPKARKI